MYEALSKFAQTAGLVYFFAIFAGVLVYACWPRNQKTFDEAAILPLSDREPGDE